MARDRTTLSPDALKTFLAAHPSWKTVDGQLERTIEFRAFLEGIAYVLQLAQLAEQQDHHPDIDIRFRKVTTRLFTHDAKGLTARDVQLAELADGLAAQFGF